MFVLSLKQFMKLRGDAGNLGGSLMDLGAGDGEVTSRLGRIYEKVYVTEVSSIMQSLLRSKGFR